MLKGFLCTWEKIQCDRRDSKFITFKVWQLISRLKLSTLRPVHLYLKNRFLRGGKLTASGYQAWTKEGLKRTSVYYMLNIFWSSSTTMVFHWCFQKIWSINWIFSSMRSLKTRRNSLNLLPWKSKKSRKPSANYILILPRINENVDP